MNPLEIRSVPQQHVKSYIITLGIVNIVVYILATSIEVPLEMFQICFNTIIADAWWWKKYDKNQKPPNKPGPSQWPAGRA
jgi:hypothetical protein